MIKQTTHAEEDANWRELSNWDELDNMPPEPSPVVLRLAIGLCVAAVVLAVVL